MSSSSSLPSPVAVARLVAAIAKLSGPRFVGFTYRAKESGELARHVLIVGASYENVLRQSIQLLRLMMANRFSGVTALAADELYASLVESMQAFAKGESNPAYTKADTYEAICEGIKVHKLDGSLEIAGLSHSKTVLEAGTFKRVNSSPKTLAKAALRKQLPIGKYRTFALDAGAMESVRISGNEIEVS